jgi:hypothetical protein
VKRVLSLLILLLAAEGPTRPEAAVPFFTNVREVQIAQPDRQNYFVVDAEIWAHARPDLGDLRLWDGNSPVEYALAAQEGGVSSEEVAAKILNLGSVGGHTEFDLDAGGLPEYDRVRLRLDAHDFVATASVSGGSAAGKAREVELTPSTLYDFTKEQLGSNFLLKLPASSFRFLHVRLAPGIRPQQVRGAAIYNLHEQKASWTPAGSCGSPQQKPHMTVFTCDIPAKVPVDRVLFQVAPEQINFRRTISVEDGQGAQLASEEVSRVRVNRGGTLVTSEEMAVGVSSVSSRLTVIIDNGDNPPLTITSVQPLALERRIYFDPAGKAALRLYYGDEKLPPPDYDYARFFHVGASPAEAQLAVGEHNPLYTGRADDRPWSERHTAVLWTAMVLAVAGLAALALRGFRTEMPQ